jgi:tetratricopeptide (TPR) repeat protein
MTAVLRDAYGLAVSTSSRAAVDAHDRGVRALLGFGADTVECFRQALAADPDFVLARATLAVALYLDEQIPEARAEIERAVADGAVQAASLTPRERRHLDALRLFVGGRGNDAIAVMQEILADSGGGRSAEMLEVTRAVLPALTDDGYALGYHAFALEENRRFDDALALAERAVALNPRDAWAVHAIAHVHYERGGRLFESVFGRIPIAIASDLQDSVALAWRLDLFGRPDPRRWAQLGAAARRWLDMPRLPFHDLHVGMALAAAGDWGNAALQLDRLRQRGAKSKNPTLAGVVVPLMEGLHAFARGDYAAAVARIEPVEGRIVEVGGSHAQREVFHDTLLAAALRGSEPRAVTLLERRLAKRPNPGHFWEKARAS